MDARADHRDRAWTQGIFEIADGHLKEIDVAKIGKTVSQA
jgi:hypothetical protein